MADPTSPSQNPDLPRHPRLRLTEPPPEACDGLAEMFLGERMAPPLSPSPSLQPVEPDDPSARRGGGDAARRVEAIVLGHLPVLPAAWIGVYAQHRSLSSARPVAMAQLRPGAATIEWRDANAPTEAPACATLDDALRHAADADWLLRLPELSEPSLAELSGLTHLTILTGADEAAIVATYRVLKSLSTRLDAITGATRPRLTVAVLGKPGGVGRRDAENGAERIRSTATAFLDLEPEIEIFQGRIEPRRRHTLYTGAAPEAQAVLDRLANAPRRSLVEPAAPSEGVELGELAASVMDDLSAAEPTPTIEGASHRVIEPAAWSAYIDGLEPLGVECPYATGVELAIDPVGRLHLLAEAMDLEAKPTPPGDAAASLLNAASWAHDHRALLALKDARLAAWLDDASAPALHIVVADAREARPLLDTSLTVHLAVRATPPGADRPARDGMILVDLNDPE